MATLLFTENFFNVWDCNMFCFSFLNRIFFVIRYYYIHRLQRKKEGDAKRTARGAHLGKPRGEGGGPR